jgi:hypothetical protein
LPVALQRASPTAQVKQALALQVVEVSESVQSCAVEQVAQSVKPVRPLLQACKVRLPVPEHRVAPASQRGASQLVFLPSRESTQSSVVAHVPSNVPSELMRLGGHW